jgi:hypothetical protein
MSFENERIYYIGIKIYNSNKNSPIFNWSSHGNIAMAVAIAKEEVSRKIPIDRESHYSMMVRIRNDKSNKTEFEWDNRQGQIRSALETTDDFVRNKLGFDLVREIRDGMEQESNKGKV